MPTPIRESIYPPSNWRKIATSLIDPLAGFLNEFYKKGCQEKKLRLDRRRDFFLEIQPTLFRNPEDGWLVVPFS